MLNTQLNFKKGKKKYQFKIRHNLDEFGLSIDVAFCNWSMRTNKFTIGSFIEYVKSKDVNIICEKVN